jgi:MGT family glycosyltransferase
MTTKERGHVNPMLGVAQWLVRGGHNVGWIFLPEPPDGLEDFGIEPLTLSLVETGTDDFVTGGPELAELVRDADRLLPWIRTLLIDAVPAQVEPTRRVLRQWRAEALVVDPMLYQGIIAAHLEGLPYACISSSLNPITPEELDVPHARNMLAIEKERAALFADYGLSPGFRVCDCVAPKVNVVFSTTEYLGEELDIPDGIQLVGPSFPPDGRGETPPFPWDALDGRPLVYLSFGSQISYQPLIFQKVAEATEDLGVQLVLSCGPLALEPFARSLPSHVISVGFAPQLELLERARVVVTHGGANTVMESLAYGIPILISPVCNDQTMQAFFLRRSGAGLELDLYGASPEAIRSALSALLADDSPQRLAAREIQRSYAASEGAKKAAELVESILP